jgi:hypothetical protein
MENVKRPIRGFYDLNVHSSKGDLPSAENHVKDAYRIEADSCEKLIDVYDKASRQLYNLSLACSNFKE